MVVPLHPAADFGVTVMVAVIGEVVVLVAVNSEIFPMPLLKPSPMAGLLFVQVQVAAFTLLPVKVISGCDAPAQRVMLGMLSNIGSGFTVATTGVREGEKQPVVELYASA